MWYLCDEERCIQGFGGGPDGRRALARPRCRWDGNIKVGLQEVEWGRGLDNLAQDRDKWRAFVENAVTNLSFLYNAGNFSTSWGPISFSSTALLHRIS